MRYLAKSLGEPFCPPVQIGLRIFLYLYLFILSSLATGPLSVCVTVILNVFRLEELSLSPWLNKNTLILSFSLHANFASLTLKALGFFLPVQHWGVFSTPHCKTRSKHRRKLKFTGLIAYVMFYKISKFESLTIINDVIMTSLLKTM